MKVTSSGIIDGVIQPQYGGRGTQFNENNISTYSLSLNKLFLRKEAKQNGLAK